MNKYAVIKRKALENTYPNLVYYNLPDWNKTVIRWNGCWSCSINKQETMQSKLKHTLLLLKKTIPFFE